MFGITYIISRIAPDGYSTDTILRMPTADATRDDVLSEAYRRGYRLATLPGTPVTVWIDTCEDGCEDWEQVN